MKRILKWLAIPALALALLAGWVAWIEFGSDPAEEASRLVTELGLGKAFVLADVGAGDGRLVIPLARQYPAARLFATEIEQDRLSTLDRKLAEVNAANVTLLLGDAAHANLPISCCDAIVLRRVYHHIQKPAEFNASLADALGPGGRLAIIDFQPSLWVFWLRLPSGVPADRGGHGVAPEIVRREIEAAGFALVKHLPDWHGRDFCSVFERKSTP